jgi:hypothetical protein
MIMETTNTPTPMMPAILYFSVGLILSSERPIFILLWVFFQVRTQGSKCPPINWKGHGRFIVQTEGLRIAVLVTEHRYGEKE